MNLKLPFGLKDNKLVQIFDVESGLKCNCFCPACGHPLVAKKGSVVMHHFAHHKQSDCQTALETSLHLAAKKVIEDAGYIMLPKVRDDIFYLRQIELSDSMKLYFDKIYLEKRFDDFIPDIIIEKNNKLLFVEIYVTHSVDGIKLDKIQKSKISTIEVDLSKEKYQIDFNKLKEQVVDSLENKKWLYNSKRDDLHKKIINQSLKKIIIYRGLARHVDGCPLPARIWKGKPYANFTDDCLGCKYFIVPQIDEREDLMYCIGHKTEEEINGLLTFKKHT